MHTTLRKILSVVSGSIIGSIVNMGIILGGMALLTLPEGVDYSTPEKVTESLPLLQPFHFIHPFLAHALGSLVGAFVATKIAPSFGFIASLIIGVFFLIGGIQMSFMVPSPTWFTIIDLGLAYIPAALLGYLMARTKASSSL